MSRHQIFLVSVISSLVTIAIIFTGWQWLGRAAAAPLPEMAATSRQQQSGSSPAFIGVSAMAFAPLNQETRFNKDPQRQILTLSDQSRNSTIFVAPLSLPDRSRLTGITVFGEDFDNQGAVRLRLTRCDHGQPRCVTLAETTSTDNFAAGQFETIKVAILNEVVDNNFYNYFLELELTAIFNSGLRSVRLEAVGTGSAAPPAGNVEPWSLSGSATSFPLPNLDWTEVRVCTDDLSQLDNPTHYPILVVDGQSTQLASNTCLTTWGRDIEIRRRLNTGPSSGTYQFLR